MKKIFVYFGVILLSGCATVTSGNYHPVYRGESNAYSELNAFCKTHRLRYNFDTLDDIVHLTSSSADIKLLIDSHYAFYNGQIISLKRAPYYSKGKVFVPIELAGVVFVKKPPVSISSQTLPPAGYRFKPISIRTIVIDPGHGGKDPGAISRRGLKEKYITIKIARYLKKELQARGFKVYLTRNSDVYLTLRERVQFAKRHKADLFISVHANSNRSRRIRGTEVYYLSEKYFDSESKAVVMAENAPFHSSSGLFPKNTQRIVWDLMCVENNTISLDFANTVVSTLRSMGFKVRSPKGAPFYVLKYAYVPSILVESGYLSNSYEEKLLRKPYYQKQIAHGVALSVSILNRHYAKLVNMAYRGR